jgi:LuxR family transcriptional regulator, maltose regulon positive regulatory protein
MQVVATDPVDSASPSSGSHHGPPGFAFEPVTTRAIAQLLEARPFPKLVTVTAPPGYGKTVLLTLLHREFLARGQRCLWVTLDDRDADASALIYRLRTALGQIGVALPADASGLQAAFHDRAAQSDSIVNVLAHLQGATLLVLDNLGYCEDKALAPLLERLVFGTGAGLSLALSSTREIPVDAVRAKLELGAIELRARHLSFDRNGTAQMLQQAGISATTERDLDHIMKQTEGWPAAVRLLQVLLASEHGAAPDIGDVLRRFSGDQGDVAHVLTHRVLVGFKPELVRFMVELALVREFNADLAIHMTGQADARAWLEMLVSRNVLTFPLDSSRRWFRFHTLMRDFLLAEAAEVLSAERRRELLERAAHWYRERGDDVAAIGMALEAGSIALAQELLDRIARVVVGDQGQMGALIQWVDRLVQAGAQPSMEAHAWYVWALCDSLQYERARKALDDFDQRFAADPAFADGGSSVHSRLLFLRMLVNVFIDRLDAAYDQATAWLASGATGDALTLSTVTSIAGIAEIDRGELSAARLRMERARAAIDRSDSAFGLAWVCILRACVEIGQARPAAADELLSAGREQVVRVIGNDASVVVTLDFVHARALLDLGRISAARELALRGLARAMHHGIVGSLEHGLIASVACWGDDHADGVREDQLDAVANCYLPRGPALLGASQVRRLLALGRASRRRSHWPDRCAAAASRRTDARAWRLAACAPRASGGARRLRGGAP